MIALLIALIAAVPTATVTTAVVSGQQKEICEWMEGTYTPTQTDICPGGKWSKVYQVAAEKTHSAEQQPTK